MRRTRSIRCSRWAGARTHMPRSRGCSTRPLPPPAGGPPLDEQEASLAGYRGSQPVRIGNAAWRQTQLGVYGDLLDTAWRYVDEGNALDDRTQSLVVSILDHLASHWRN